MCTIVIEKDGGGYFGNMKFEVIDIDKVLSDDTIIFPYTKLASFINKHDRSIKQIIEINSYTTIDTDDYDLITSKFRKTINSISMMYTNAVIIYRVIPGSRKYSDRTPTIQDYRDELIDGELLATSAGFIRVDNIFDYDDNLKYTNDRSVVINHKRQNGNGYVGIVLYCNIFIYTNSKSRLILQKYAERKYGITMHDL